MSSIIKEEKMQKTEDDKREITKEKYLSIKSLIAKLKEIDESYSIAISIYRELSNPKSFGSYRGYYEDLAVGYSKEIEDIYPQHGFEDKDNKECSNLLSDKPTVKNFLNVLETCGWYEGYKGGSYKINLDGPLWCSDYGDYTSLAVCKFIVKSKQVILETGYYSY